MISTRKIFLLLTAALLLVGVNSAMAKKHIVPGMSTYGVSTEYRTCPRCGTVYMSGDSHLCETPDRSSYTPVTGNTADAEAAAGMISGDPTLKVNQTSFTPIDYSQVARNNSAGNNYSEDDYGYGYPEEYEEEDDSHTTRDVILAILIAGGVYWYFKRK